MLKKVKSAGRAYCHYQRSLSLCRNDGDGKEPLRILLL
jgi:hypothetical protein